MLYKCKTLDETATAGKAIFKQLSLPTCVYLEGELGAGKTALCQSIIRAAGYCGVVTSPTYNLIHEYVADNVIIYHMDFYRLDDPSEVQYLGLEDLWCEKSLFLIEWPSKAVGVLRAADWTIEIESEDDVRIVNLGNVAL